MRDTVAAPGALGGLLSPRAASLLLQGLQVAAQGGDLSRGDLWMAADGTASAEVRRVLGWLLHHPDGQALWQRLHQADGTWSAALLQALAEPPAETDRG